MTNKPRLLIVQPNMQPPGGGPSVSAWATVALQDEYALDLFTWTPLEVNEVNRFYGTRLDADKFRKFQMPGWVRLIYRLDPDPWSFQPLALMSRLVKIIRRQYDVVLSFCDEVDFGAPTIQYIHYPYLRRFYEGELAQRARGRVRAMRERLRPWRLVSGFSFERMVQNMSLVNSDWTGRHFTETYAAPFHKLYPPVPGDFPNALWSERANHFVCIGRLSREKRFEDIMEILSRVRARGHAVELHIIGTSMGRLVDTDYNEFLRNLLKTHREWVSLHEKSSRVELTELVAHCKYGIHARYDEHFGIAPAEMARAGCIVFVPNDGGQVEIVGNEDRLRYNSISDATEKIIKVLQDENTQTELRAALAARADLYTPERFMASIRRIVDEFMDRRN